MEAAVGHGSEPMETMLLSALGISTVLALLAVLLTSDQDPDGFNSA